MRRLVIGEQGTTSLGCLISWFTAPDPGDLDGWFEMHLPGRGRVASIRPGRLPGEAKAMLGLRVEPGACLPSGVEDQQALRTRRFADVGWRVPELLSAIRASADFAFAEVGQMHLPC